MALRILSMSEGEAPDKTGFSGFVGDKLLNRLPFFGGTNSRPSLFAQSEPDRADWSLLCLSVGGYF